MASELKHSISRCDNITNTLTLVKTSRQYVFAGFTSQTWGSPSNLEYKSDSRAFLVSLVNEKNTPIVLNINGGCANAIALKSDWGPTFSLANSDIHLVDYSNETKTNFCNPSSYRLGDQIYDKNLLAGEQYFQAIEIETFNP